MGVEKPAVATNVTPGDMLAAIASAWLKQMGSYPTQSQICTLLAQWALETGSGVSMICFNVGNFKRPDPSAGDYCSFSTTERIMTKTGWQNAMIRPPNPGCRFAAYATLEEGCEAYIHAMYTRWAHAWPSVVAGDPGTFALKLHEAGYYTADPALYVAGCKRYFGRFLALPWVDRDRPTNPEMMKAIPPDVEVAVNQPNTPDDPTEPT